MPRIIAGDFRGRRLATPSEGTRPTSDRVREAVASMLGSRMDLAGTRVLDLYAGTGALALEVVSRGADTAVLVEADRTAAAVARKNVDVCAAGSRVRVVNRSAEAFLAATPGERFDLVFLDPPYDVSSDDLTVLLDQLVPHLSDDAWVVLERGKRSDPVTWPSILHVEAEKVYGDSRVTLASSVNVDGEVGSDS